MGIRLEKLLLDRDNPRFIIPRGQNTAEEEIFTYLRNDEVLDELIDGISRAGFYQIGERPIVMQKDGTDEYIVLEGNRRICALKALHGFYSRQYAFDTDKKSASEAVEVDIVSTREEIQPYLAARHIQGIKRWRPEARRNFYYKHYLDGKTLTSIQEMTLSPMTEIKTFIRQSLFLDFFKRVSGHNDITEPSLIYERIYGYMINLKMVAEIIVMENRAATNIIIQTTIISNPDFEEFCRLLADAIYGQNSYIDSRTASTLLMFKDLLQGPTTTTRHPRLKYIFEQVLLRLRRDNFVPFQRVFTAIKDKVPPINQIIDYSIIADTATVEILNGTNVITEGQLISGVPGSYTIKINRLAFRFEIKDYLTPAINVREEPFKNLQVGTTEDITNFVSIYDVYGDRVALNSPSVVIATSNNELVITSNRNLLVESAGIYTFTIRYSFNNDPDYTITKTVFVEGKAINGTPLSLTSSYFNFQYIDVNSITQPIMTGKLLDELKYNYDTGRHHIFASALRSLLELALGDFKKEARTHASTSIWANKRMALMCICNIPR